MESIDEFEMSSDKQILFCLGESLSQPRIDTDFVNFELSAIYFKGGINPIHVGSLDISGLISDTSYKGLFPLRSNPSMVMVTFAEVCLLIGLLTDDQRCDLLIVRRLELIPKSSLQSLVKIRAMTYCGDSAFCITEDGFIAQLIFPLVL